MKISYADIRKICLKPDESEKPLYARWITHTLSTRLLWLLQDARFTPNQISTTALILSAASLPFFVWMLPASLLLGALLVESYYILDAADGQWARLKQMKSLTGAFLDYLSNYALQPPLLFAIAWGVFLKTDEPRYLLLGFLSAFSTLWINLIWNLRATILLEHLLHTGQAPQIAKYGKKMGNEHQKTFLKTLFGSVHKSLVFPWFMNILTLLCILSFFERNYFPQFLYYCGFAGPLIALLLTFHWIRTKKIDHAPEIFK